MEASASIVVILLAGMVVPITLLVGAVLFDLCVLSWAMYRLWNDRFWPWAWQIVRSRVIAPIAHPRARVPVLKRAI